MRGEVPEPARVPEGFWVEAVLNLKARAEWSLKRAGRDPVVWLASRLGPRRNGSLGPAVWPRDAHSPLLSAARTQRQVKAVGPRTAFAVCVA